MNNKDLLNAKVSGDFTVFEDVFNRHCKGKHVYVFANPTCETLVGLLVSKYKPKRVYEDLDQGEKLSLANKANQSWARKKLVNKSLYLPRQGTFMDNEGKVRLDKANCFVFVQKLHHMGHQISEIFNRCKSGDLMIIQGNDLRNHNATYNLQKHNRLYGPAVASTENIKELLTEQQFDIIEIAEPNVDGSKENSQIIIARKKKC